MSNEEETEEEMYRAKIRSVTGREYEDIKPYDAHYRLK